MLMIKSLIRRLNKQKQKKNSAFYTKQFEEVSKIKITSKLPDLMPFKKNAVH